MKTKLLFGLLLTGATAFGQAGANDPTFNPMDSIVGAGKGPCGSYYHQVQSIVLQPDGKSLICGAFDYYNGTPRNGFARINADGHLDLSFNPVVENGDVNAIAVQPDGKIVIAGTFTSCNGLPRNQIARLNGDGSLDLSFVPGSGLNPAGSLHYAAVAVQPDGKIIVAGDFSFYHGMLRRGIVRINSDGSVDQGFNPGAGSDLDDFSRVDLALQPDGKIVLIGEFNSYDGTPRNGIARINSDGSLDLTFDPGTGPDPFGDISAVALQPDGKILIGGYFTSYDGTPLNRIARLKSDGSLDPTFNPGSGANSAVECMVLQPDGKILIGGYFTSYNGTPRSWIARINSNGSLDLGFDSNVPTTDVPAMALQPDGKILLTSLYVSADPEDPPPPASERGLERINNDGSKDMAFNTNWGANDKISSVAIQPDGKILIGGSFSTYNGTSRNDIARLNSDGSLDLTFNPGTGTGAANWIATIALQPDGKILIGGEFSSYNGTGRGNIARINSDGSLDLTFDPGSGVNSGVYTMALQPDGKILIGGSFSAYNGTARTDIARVNSDGSLDLSFDPGTGTDGIVNTMAIQPDGKILAGGNFASYNGTPRSNLMRLNNNGSLDAGFNAGVILGNGYDAIEDLDLQSDGKILIGGRFSTINGIPRRSLARLQGNGALDPSFASPTSISDGYLTVRAVDVQNDGKILIGGSFYTVPVTDFNKTIARLNNDGSIDTDFNPGAGFDSGPCDYPAQVQDIAVQPDGKILVGGFFVTYRGLSRNNIARILTDRSITLTLGTDAHGSETTWELTTSNGSPVASGGPYPDGAATVVTEKIPVPPGCYNFLLHDAGGNGIDDGGYVLSYGNGQRIIDANGEFGSLSTTGTKFCVPLGPVSLVQEDCDDLDHSAIDAVHCDPLAGAIAYQFWAFDPHGTFSVRTINHLAQIGPNQLTVLPVDLELNMRVRALYPDSTFTSFGPACTFMIASPGMAPAEPRSLAVGSGTGLTTWPNPTSGEYVQVSSGGLDETLPYVQIRVYDATGRQAMATALPLVNGSLNSTMELGHLAQGIYQVQVIAGERVQSTSLVVAK